MSNKLITTMEAAARLGVNQSRVRQFIKDGRLKATLYGKTYLIEDSDLEPLKERRPGRRPKVRPP